MSSKHCTREKLLAYLDGELPPAESRQVAQHLSTCWRCRANAHEIETVIAGLIAECAPSVFPHPWQVAEAKHRFLSWCESGYSPQRQSRPPDYFVPLQPGFSRPVAATVVVACALVAFLFAVHTRPSAEAVLAQAEHAEQFDFSQGAAIHESFRLKIQPNGQSSSDSGGQLEVWSEPVLQRFSWRWEDKAQHLRFAEWHPTAQQHYIFDRHSRRAVLSNVQLGRAPLLLGELCEPAASIDDLNTVFAEWVQSHQWRVISLARDFARFSGQAGTTLSIRRIQTPQGRSRLELVAQRVDGDKQSTVTLEIDQASGRPLAETAKVSIGHQVAVLRISVNRVEVVEAKLISAAVFRPEILAEKTRFSQPKFEKKAENTRPTASVADPRALEEAEVELVYALHKAGLCRGTPLILNLDLRSRKVLLDGVVESAQVKQQIASAIQYLHISGLVRNNIRTTAEAVTASKPQASGTTPTVPDLPDARSMVLPIEALIEASGQTDAAKSLLKQDVADRASRLVSAVENLTSEAWALHHLALRFGQATNKPLSLRARYLVSTMTRDHRMALEQSSSEVEALIAPFRSLVKGPAIVVRPVEAESGSNWRTLLEDAKRINDSSRALFALGNSPQSEPNESIAELFSALSQFQTVFGQCEQPNRFLSTTEIDHNVHFSNPEPRR